jgi:hypothetical protein
MAGYEQKDNSGTLFKNDKREKDSHPHAKGSAMIDGVEYWVSAWTKEGSKGKFQSLSFQRKEQRQPERQQQASRPAPRELDDEIPF